MAATLQAGDILEKFFRGGIGLGGKELEAGSGIVLGEDVANVHGGPAERKGPRSVI